MKELTKTLALLLSILITYGISILFSFIIPVLIVIMVYKKFMQ